MPRYSQQSRETLVEAQSGFSHVLTLVM